MSLFEATLRKLIKDEVIALTLEYQAKFDNTLSNINKELSELVTTSKKLNQSCLLQNCKYQVARTSGCIRGTMLGE